MPIRTADDARAYGRDLLRGRAVRLRATTEDDLAALDAWWEDPEQQALQQLAVRPRPAGSSTEAHRRWASNADSSGAGFSIEEIDGGDFAGHVTLWGARLPERDAHLAMVVGPQHQGRGLGGEAVRLMVRYGFLAMGLNRIQLETFAFNDRALRAYRGAGFVQEGVRREAVWIDGGFQDEVIMSILRREWTP